MRPLADGVRALGIEARKVSTRDMLLAMRLERGTVDIDLPVSASIRADIAPDGTPQVVQGELYTDPGSIVDHSNESRASRSSAPTSASTGMRTAAVCWCRSRSTPAAINSPCAPCWSRRSTWTDPGA